MREREHLSICLLCFFFIVAVSGVTEQVKHANRPPDTETAVGLDRHHKRTWSATLAKLNPFATTEGRSEDGKLPRVSLAAVPRSWDPDAERERVEAAERHADDMGMDGSSEREDGDEGGQDGGDEDDEIESLDVLMTGMGEQ